MPRDKDMDTGNMGDNDGNDNNSGESKEKEDREKQGGEDGDEDKNNKSNKRIVINDPKDMKCKEFTILHHLLTYTDVNSIALLKKMVMEMQQKDQSIIFYPTNKRSRPQPCNIHFVEEDFLDKMYKFQEFFYTINNNNQTKYVFIVLTILTNVELKRQMKCFLDANC